MTAALPFDSALEEVVQQLGIGPYDASRDGGDGPRGEDARKRVPKKSLPDGGGPAMADGAETLISYPTETQTTPTAFASVKFDPQGDYAAWLYRAERDRRVAVGGLPGDADRPPQGRNKGRPDETVDSVVHSESNSQLPNDAGNPSARSDYYDRMRQGLERAPDPKGSEVWADEDSGAYAGETLPQEPKLETETDNYLGALGNAWSGRNMDDQSGATGHPTEDYLENVDFPRSDLDGGGKIMASGRRIATNIGIVEELTAGLIKRYGKKDLTRRHVMAFLKEVGKSQYLASDVIRCLKLSHKVYVKDVLDEFPVVKTASVASSITSTRAKLVDLEILHMAQPETASQLRRCAASLSDVIAKVERLAMNPMVDYDDYAPARGHAEDNSAHEAYKDYLEDWDGNRDVGEEPVSYEEFLEGKK
jgi:hypothetical protein